MKKIILGLMLTSLALTFNPLQMVAAPDEPVSSTTAPKPAEPVVPEEAKVLLNRLDEIKKIDAKTLTHAEKKNLHKEVRSIKKELKEISGGVYISVAALILIVLLLVILL